MKGASEGSSPLKALKASSVLTGTRDEGSLRDPGEPAPGPSAREFKVVDDDNDDNNNNNNNKLLPSLPLLPLLLPPLLLLLLLPLSLPLLPLLPLLLLPLLIESKERPGRGTTELQNYRATELQSYRATELQYYLFTYYHHYQASKQVSSRKRPPSYHHHHHHHHNTMAGDLAELIDNRSRGGRCAALCTWKRGKLVQASHESRVTGGIHSAVLDV